MQGAEPVALLYVPATHAVQVPPSGPVYPALHARIQALLDVLATGEVRPAGQPRQAAAAVAPAVAEYVPAAQGVHAELPLALL